MCVCARQRTRLTWVRACDCAAVFTRPSLRVQQTAWRDETCPRVHGAHVDWRWLMLQHAWPVHAMSTCVSCVRDAACATGRQRRQSPVTTDVEGELDSPVIELSAQQVHPGPGHSPFIDTESPNGTVNQNGPDVDGALHMWLVATRRHSNHTAEAGHSACRVFTRHRKPVAGATPAELPACAGLGCVQLCMFN